MAVFLRYHYGNKVSKLFSNTCFKGEGSCIDLILTNRKYSFKNTCSFETGLSDHHHLIYSVMKTTFKSEEPENLIYRDYSNFSSECFKDNFMSSICQEKHDYSDFEKKFIYTLNKQAPKKIKTFRANQKPHINKTFHKAILKRSQLKNKTSKTRNATDILNYKKKRNYVVKLNNQCKKDHFDRLNPVKDSKPFWKSCKPYFSNKHSFGVTVCSCHVTYAFESESTLYSCLNVKELLARSRREI